MRKLLDDKQVIMIPRCYHALSLLHLAAAHTALTHLSAENILFICTPCADGAGQAGDRARGVGAQDAAQGPRHRLEAAGWHSYPSQAYPSQAYPSQAYPGQSYPSQAYPRLMPVRIREWSP